MDEDGQGMGTESGLTNRQRLEIAKAFIKRWAELALEEASADMEQVDSLDVVDQLYLAAHWKRLVEHILENRPRKSSVADEKWWLIYEEFGASLELPSSILKKDIAARFDWMKRRIAKDYERAVLRKIDDYGVVSPIEQIFLMEWTYQRVEERLGVRLHPQRRLKEAVGEPRVDFLISRHKDDPEGRNLLAVELDGYDFHDRTREQATKDRRRERAIIRSGVPLLRFSGAEICREPRSCVLEVISFVEGLISSRAE
jgi:very-short-patch-repair endonuclease